jgi:hypothetical protein
MSVLYGLWTSKALRLDWLGGPALRNEDAGDSMDRAVIEGATEHGPRSGLTREQLLDRILAMNTSATTAFLAEFSTASLDMYHEHLQAASQPRGRNARWIREARTSATSVAVARD